jgi:hypothetical protein
MEESKMVNTGSTSFENQVRRLLSEANSELAKIDVEMKTLENRRTVLKQDIQGYESTLNSYLRRSGKQVPDQTDWNEPLRECKTHTERLKVIAKRNGGQIKATDAADILYGGGFLKKSSNRKITYIMVQNMLARMTKKGIFEKVTPGTYKLVETQ